MIKEKSPAIASSHISISQAPSLDLKVRSIGIVIDMMMPVHDCYITGRAATGRRKPIVTACLREQRGKKQ